MSANEKKIRKINSLHAVYFFMIFSPQNNVFGNTCTRADLDKFVRGGGGGLASPHVKYSDDFIVLNLFYRGVKAKTKYMYGSCFIPT